MKTLAVYLRENRIGTLEQGDSGLLRFTYRGIGVCRAALPTNALLDILDF